MPKILEGMKLVKGMKMIDIPDADDSWSEVELYRWQHGHLPGTPGHEAQPLDVSAGLHGMAKAIELGDSNNFPTPFNVVEVLKYAARRVEDFERTKKALETANKILSEHGLIGVLPDQPNETTP